MADFARHVGLARTTVSKVLNGHPGVRPATIERVRQAMTETGFTPNAYATSLKGKRAATVGICMENLLTPPVVGKLAALQRQLRRRGHASLIEVLGAGESRQVIQHFLSMRAEAIVFIGQFTPAELAERITELRRLGLPHLTLDQTDISEANSISLDRARAMELVVEHLIGLGHRSFGLLGISGTVQSIRDRLRGIEKALRAHGLDPAVCTRSFDYLEPRQSDFVFGRHLAQQFAKLPDPPTALLGLNDDIAAGALLELQNLGRRVPEEFSITGFNNQDICQMTRPALSTVDQQIEVLAETAVDLLFRQIEKPTAELLRQSIEPVFIPRGSTGPARAR